MGLQDTCDLGSGEDVELLYMIDDCSCPGDTPKAPIKLEPLDVGSRALNETRSTVEDPNAYGGTCIRSVSDGAEGSLPFTHSFCANQAIRDAAMGSLQIPFEQDLVAMSVDAIAPVNPGDPNIFRSNTTDFYNKGLRAGMVIFGITGFAEADLNRARVITYVSPAGSSPSEIYVYGDENTPEYPVFAADETGNNDISFNMGYFTHQGKTPQNILLERRFPNALHNSGSSGVYQVALGGNVESYSEEIEPGAFMTGTMDFRGSEFQRNNANSIGTDVSNFECDCEEKTFFDPLINLNIEMFFDGVLVCFESIDWEVTRNNGLNRNSCGQVIIPGKPTASGTINYPFVDDLFLQKINESGALTILIWNEDRSMVETRLFTKALMSGDTIDPDDEEQVVQEASWTAQTDPAFGGRVVSIQRNFETPQVARNRVEFTVDVVTATVDTRTVIITGGAIDDVFEIDWGDGTVESIVQDADPDTLSHTYGADGEYDIVIYSLSDTPWTGVEVSTLDETFDEVNLCYLQPYLDTLVYDETTETSIDLSSFINLEDVTILGPALASLVISNSPITNLDVQGAVLTESVVDAILLQLVRNGLSSGTVDLSGGSSAAPSTVGDASATILTGRGWTVTTN